MAPPELGSRFDPRIHSMTTLMVKERMARKGPGSDEYEVKQFVLGPAVPKETLRIQSSRVARSTSDSRKTRPVSAPRATTIKHDASPPYLDNKGKWVPDKLPVHPLTNQSQSLSASTKLIDTILQTKAGPRTIRPVAAVHAYLDNSPITTAEFVYGPYPDEADQGLGEGYDSHAGAGAGGKGGYRPGSAASASRPATAGGYGGSRPVTPAPPAPRTPEMADAPSYTRRTAATTHGQTHKGRPTTAFPNASLRQAVRQQAAQARASSARRPTRADPMRASAPTYPTHYQHQQHNPQFLVNGSGYGTGVSTMSAPLEVPGPPEPYTWPRLSADDISRITELGKHAVPGSAQTRLIGGKWRYVPRPVEGDVVFCDYYGPIGGGYTQNSYYGRSYNNAISMRELDQSRLVEDTAYHRVGASMAGITTLRTRPGLSLETKIIHASQPEQLLEAAHTSPEALGLHHLKTYHRIKPAAPEL